MKKYALLLVVLALSTSAWGYTVGTCNPNPCWSPSPCWNPCPCPGVGQSGYSCASTNNCVKPTCGPVAGIVSWQNANGLQINTCHGSFSDFDSCSGSKTFGCRPCGDRKSVV